MRVKVVAVGRADTTEQPPLAASELTNTDAGLMPKASSASEMTVFRAGHSTDLTVATERFTVPAFGVLAQS